MRGVILSLSSFTALLELSVTTIINIDIAITIIITIIQLTIVLVIIMIIIVIIVLITIATFVYIGLLAGEDPGHKPETIPRICDLEAKHTGKRNPELQQSGQTVAAVDQQPASSHSQTPSSQPGAGQTANNQFPIVSPS